MAPQFSIVMANYNNGQFIDEAVQSVLAQTFTDWELIIVDDASTDDSVARLQRYTVDARIRLFAKRRNDGYTKALIDGLTKVSSGVVGILDSDDALTPWAIDRVNEIFSRRPEIGTVLTQLLFCDSTLKPTVGTINTPKHLLEPLLWARGPNAFRSFRLAVYEKTTGLDERIRYAEDCDLLYKLEEVAAVFRIDEPLYLYRMLPSSQSNEARKHHISSRSAALAQYLAYLRRLRNTAPRLPQQELLARLIAAVRYSIELEEPWHGLAFAIRALRVAPTGPSAFRSLRTALAACVDSLRGAHATVSTGTVRMTKLRFMPVREFQSNTGNREPDRILCLPKVHPAGHCLFGGDLRILESGEYQVSFELDVVPYSFAQNPVLTLDVYENLQLRAVIAERQVSRAECSGRPSKFSLAFSAMEGQRIEFRVYWAEQCNLSVTGIALYRICQSMPETDQPNS